MTLIDSAAAFERRCDQLRGGLKELFATAGITTFSSLAFKVGTPQAVVSDDAMQRFSDTIHGGPSTVGDCSIVKRLHFEATTLVMADLRSQISSTDASEPVKKLPFVEKLRRSSLQKERITGILQSNEQQPSHALIDACFNMVESGSLIYIPPSKCGSRESEIHAESKGKTEASPYA